MRCECDMGQPPSIEFNEVQAGLALLSKREFDRFFDRIEDPETGLALLSERLSEETPEQALNRLFWQDQFMQWRDWRAGDVLAVWRAAASCALSKKPPPAWLCRATEGLFGQCLSDDAKHAHSKFAKTKLPRAAVNLRCRHSPLH